MTSPAHPIISGQQLTDSLMKQIEPFSPTFHFGQMAETVTKTEDGKWRVTTDLGTIITAPVMIIAAGGGSFMPKNRLFQILSLMKEYLSFYAVRKWNNFAKKSGNCGRRRSCIGLDIEFIADCKTCNLGASAR